MNNKCCSCALWVAVLISLLNVSNEIGSLWNLKNSLSSAQQSQTVSALAATLSHSLSLDAGELIPDLWRADSAHLSKDSTSATESSLTDEQPAGHMVEAEEMEEDGKINGGMSNGRKAKKNNDILDLLPVSCSSTVL